MINQLPKDNFGNISDNVYGIAATGDVPNPALVVHATPKEHIKSPVKRIVPVLLPVVSLNPKSLSIIVFQDEFLIHYTFSTNSKNLSIPNYIPISLHIVWVHARSIWFSSRSRFNSS